MNLLKFSGSFLFIGLVLLTSCVKKQSTEGTLKTNGSGTKVTFIELGSVNCVPCKMMQPVMKQIEEAYKEQVKVVFYDIWTEEGKPFGQAYGIRAIPTQVFLDSEGKEFYRHEGYFPYEELVQILKQKGVQ